MTTIPAPSEAPVPASLAPVFPEYRIISSLPAGDAILAYRAVRVADGTPVLLRMPRRAYATAVDWARYQWEFDIVGSLDIPGVTRVHELTSYEGRPVIVLEDVGGPSIAELLRTRPLAIAESLELAARLAGTLHELHDAGVIHCGVCPAFVRLGTREPVVLTGFGLATDLSGIRAAVSDADLPLERLPYMAPERTGRMNRSVDDRADLYSLGALLYEMLTGRPPFTGDDPLAIVYAHLATAPVPPHGVNPDVPAVLSDLVLKLLAKNPEDRYQSAEAVQTDLEECLRQWRATGGIEAFPLARHDRPRELRIPERLYGRELESAALMAAFDRSQEGAALLLVSGAPGIGKTTLVNEVHRPLARHRGQFLAGKVEPLQRTVPYAALAQAIRSWAEGVLTESEAAVAAWRDRILRALGSNAGLISEVVPELERIVGTQVPVASVTPLDAQNQLRLAFRQFLQVLAQRDHPLVLFLDDLQWADTAMLGLLQSVLTAGDVDHLLVVGAYRDTEVSDVHPLMRTVEEIKGTGTRVSEVHLERLGRPHVAELVADALGAPTATAEPLAGLVDDKTGGNPFFVREFLRNLQQDGHLHFDVPTGQWVWDLAEIRSLRVTSNVVELVAQRVRQLDPDALATLEAAAVIGGQFELGLLAAFVGLSPRETAASLTEAVREGIVVPLADSHGLAERAEGDSEDLRFAYGFGHDRIQQAVYSLLSSPAREELHLRLARLLQTRPSHGTRNPVFDIANHLHLALPLLVERADQVEYVRLNLDAARHARAASAFATAAEYHRRAIEVLGPEGWRSHYELARDLRLEGAEAAFLSGDADGTLALTEEVIRHAATEADQVRAYEIRVLADTTAGAGNEAVIEGLALLARMGVQIPSAPTKRDVLAGFAATKAALGFKKVEDLADLPLMTDERDLTVMRLLQLVSTAAYQSRPDVFPLLVFRSVILSIKRGNSPLSIQGYLGYGIILCGVTGDIKNGYKFGELALRLLDRYDARPLRPRTLFLFHSFIAHWRTHYRTTFGPLREAYQLGLESGDFHFAGLASFDYTFQAYWAGDNLSDLARELGAYGEVFRSLGGGMSVRLFGLYRQATLNLVRGGESPSTLTGESCDEDTLLPVLEADHDVNALCQLYLNKLVIAYLFGRHAEAAEHAAHAGRYLEGLTATQGVPVFHFYEALNTLALAGTGEGGPDLAVARKAVRRLRKWAGLAPMNYAHKLHLVEAELARVRGRDTTAREHYDQAIRLAGQHQFVNDAALAAELAGRHHLQRGLPQLARSYLRDAHHAYLQWGAVALARRLEESFPQFVEPTGDVAGPQPAGTATAGSPGLDVATVLRASQAISGEVELEPLLKRLMTVVMENAGARRACLLLQHQGRLRLEAEVTAENPEIAVLQGRPLDTPDIDTTAGVPLSIVNLVRHTCESVVLDDATTDSRFEHDSYVRDARPRSVLCTPLLKLGELTGVLYLENDLNRGVFTPARTALVTHVAAQAAISVDNARLFSDIQELNRASERFLPRQFLGMIDRKAVTDVVLGDHAQRELSLLFSDIRGFTSISEQLGPDGTFAFLNDFLGAMVPAIEAHHGVVDKYAGDGILALFPRQADDALNAAVAMRLGLAELNRRFEAAGRPVVRTGIGAHYGPVLMGTIGAQGRMDGTVIGDAANAASRVEGSTRGYRLPLLFTSQLHDRLEFPERFAIREIDRVRVVGRAEPLTLFEAFDADPPAVAAAKRESAPAVAEMIQRFRGGDVAGAAEHARALLARHPDDPVPDLYLRRCERYAVTGLPDGWDGVETLVEKYGPTADAAPGRTAGDGEHASLSTTQGSTAWPET